MADPDPFGVGAGGPPDSGTSRRSPGLLVLLVVGVLGVVGIAVVVVVVVLASDGSEPTTWDDRIVEYRDFVQQSRGLAFREPVDVEFIADDDEYLAAFRETNDITDEDVTDARDVADVLAVLGLVGDDYDPEEAADRIVGEGTAGFYDPTTQRLFVKGDEITPYVAGTVVHEMVHALQDQHFDLEERLDDEDTGIAYRGLVEGDAVAVELDYVESLSAGEQQEYDDEETEIVEEAGIDLEGLPESILLGESAPYTFGLLMREALRFGGEGDGTDSIDDAFEDPPTLDVELIDPGLLLDGAELTEVEVPAAPDGADVIDDGEFGILALTMMIGDRVGAPEAVDTALAWRGDGYVAYRSGDEVCVDAVFVGAGDEGTSLIERNLSAWAATMPTGSATASSTDGRIHLDVCGGAAAPAGEVGEASQALGALAARSGILVGGLSAGGTLDTSRCVADGVVDSVDIATLGDPEALAELDLSAVGADLLTSCS
ncbi:MAG: hypothetical protein R3A49_00745 [Acidimicrobiia bacterium]